MLHHAVEASLSPERALPSAERLKTPAPTAGHLVHMPAHIYMRTRDYQSAAERNRVAAEVDEAYIKKSGVQGIHPIMYYSHNLHFLAVAYAMEGRFLDAKKAADLLEAHVKPYEAQFIQSEFEAAWKNADTKLQMEDL